ncbi:hypothetical protein JCM19233_3821 [Vibrio astriarenae]|nr:hypothetical protein JCM19233_3821 [Vibrio sp. C7]
MSSQKKGVALHYSVSEWPLIIADLQPYWHYNWDKDQSEYQPQGVEFVPMVWGKRSDIDDVVSDLIERFQQGEFRYLLGFNEPDNSRQSNISVEDAIE